MESYLKLIKQFISALTDVVTNTPPETLELFPQYDINIDNFLDNIQKVPANPKLTSKCTVNYTQENDNIKISENTLQLTIPKSDKIVKTVINTKLAFQVKDFMVLLAYQYDNFEKCLIKPIVIDVNNDSNIFIEYISNVLEEPLNVTLKFRLYFTQTMQKSKTTFDDKDYIPNPKKNGNIFNMKSESTCNFTDIEVLDVEGKTKNKNKNTVIFVPRKRSSTIYPICGMHFKESLKFDNYDTRDASFFYPSREGTLIMNKVDNFELASDNSGFTGIFFNYCKNYAEISKCIKKILKRHKEKINIINKLKKTYTTFEYLDDLTTSILATATTFMHAQTILSQIKDIGNYKDELEKHKQEKAPITKKLAKLEDELNNYYTKNFETDEPKSNKRPLDDISETSESKRQKLE